MSKSPKTTVKLYVKSRNKRRSHRCLWCPLVEYALMLLSFLIVGKHESSTRKAIISWSVTEEYNKIASQFDCSNIYA